MVLGAGQAEILRAAQRDGLFTRQLTENISQIVSACFGLRKWIQWKQDIEDGTRFLYQALTTLARLQTLGEEYTGIIHWTSDHRLPTKFAEVLMILFNSFGERIVADILSRFEQKVAQAELRPEAKNSLLLFCTYFRRFLPLLVKFHQTVFYFQGRFYEFSKRITGVEYALVRFWLRDRSVGGTFQILGAVSALHLLLTVFITFRKENTSSSSPHSSSVSAGSAAKCPLCLNQRSNTACTPCGHLFCWECIVPWVSERPFCPLCRQDVQPSRVVFLQNYSPNLL